MPAYKGSVWRGMTLPEEVLEKYNVGGVVEF